MLADLQSSEFIHERPAFPDPEYVFKHALTQEVAYNSMLIERRKILHERAGQALESMFPDQLEDHLSELAHHYSSSNNVSKAVEYLGRAGQQALQRSAHADAINSLSTALALLQKLPETPERIQRELFLQLALGPALMTVKGWAASEVERVYGRTRVLCDLLRDPPEVFPALAGLFYIYLLRAELPAALEIAERMLQRARQGRDPEMMMMGHLTFGQASHYFGNLLVAKEHLEMAFSIYDGERSGTFTRHGGVDIGISTLSLLALTLWQLGYPDQSVRRIKQAVLLARALSDPPSIVFAESFAGALHHYQREFRTAEEDTDRSLALSVEHGFTFWSVVNRARRSGMMAIETGSEEAAAEMEGGLSGFAATGTQLDRPYWLSLQAQAHAAIGRATDAMRGFTEALGAAESQQDRHYEAEVYRLKGELLVKQDGASLAEAQGCFGRAMQIARKQSAKSWELRGATSLARLLRDTGRRKEARTMLAEIYGWFTEGFDTADLKDAKALIDELSA